METFKAYSGYNKNELLTFRRFTMADIEAMKTSHKTDFLFLDRNGYARQCRTNGKLQTWKTFPDRYERSFKYGMYENFRLDTQAMLSTLIVLEEGE